jgi:cardiolipin synthase
MLTSVKLSAAVAPPVDVTTWGAVFCGSRWPLTIELPQLAVAARAVKVSKEPAPFPIHEEPGGRRVFAIDEPAEIDAAAAAMSAHGVQAVVLRRER